MAGAARTKHQDEHGSGTRTRRAQRSGSHSRPGKTGRASKPSRQGVPRKGAGYGPDRSGEGKQEFGMPAIFDNIRDGLILLRYPEEVVVLFNRAASETCGFDVAEVLGGALHDIIPDPKVAETAQLCSEQAVGAWPGHHQDVLTTTIESPGQTKRAVELHFCRVDDPATGKPLVLLVMRPDDEAELEKMAAIAQKTRKYASELAERLRTRREENARRSIQLSRPMPRSASPPAKAAKTKTPRQATKTQTQRKQTAPPPGGQPLGRG